MDDGGRDDVGIYVGVRVSVVDDEEDADYLIYCEREDLNKGQRREDGKHGTAKKKDHPSGTEPRIFSARCLISRSPRSLARAHVLMNRRKEIDVFFDIIIYCYNYVCIYIYIPLVYIYLLLHSPLTWMQSTRSSYPS